jgi:hypothetical protein
MPVLSPTAVTGKSTPSRKNAIPYAVMHDIRQTSDPTTTGYTASLVVDGIYTFSKGTADLFARDLLGWSEVVNNVLQRTLPEPCGRDPRAYCVKLESVAHHPDALTDGATTVNPDGWPTYDQEAFQATYAIPLYKVLEDADVIAHEHERFCIWRSKITAQNEKIPGGGFKWIDGSVLANRTQVPEVGVKTGRMIELTCKWLDVPMFNYAKLKTLCNKVNNSTVDWNGVQYDPQTVLLTGVDNEPRINAVGDYSYDITFSFAVRTDGRTWNSFWKSGAAGYVEISSDLVQGDGLGGTASGRKPFEIAQLNNLWTFT